MFLFLLMRLEAKEQANYLGHYINSEGKTAVDLKNNVFGKLLKTLKFSMSLSRMSIVRVFSSFLFFSNILIITCSIDTSNWTVSDLL